MDRVTRFCYRPRTTLLLSRGIMTKIKLLFLELLYHNSISFEICTEKKGFALRKNKKRYICMEGYYLYRYVALMFLQDFKKHSSPITSIAKQTKIRKRALRCPNFTFLLGKLIRYNSKKQFFSKQNAWSSSFYPIGDSKFSDYKMEYTTSEAMLTESNQELPISFSLVWGKSENAS